MGTQIQRGTPVPSHEKALAISTAILGYIHSIFNKNLLIINYMRTLTWQTVHSPVRLYLLNVFLKDREIFKQPTVNLFICFL